MCTGIHRHTLAIFGRMEMNSSPYCLVLTTIGSLAEAETLAEQLITLQLAACVNILPEMQSVYQWQGRLEKGKEHQLLVKTRQEQVNTIIAAIKANHPYELPEIIAVPIATGLNEYLNWITESVTHDDKN